MLDRLELLIGKDSLNKIKKLNVVVLGLGGVGGFVAESLVRSGVCNITIVDNDTIDVTNLNRQIISNINNIGKLKTDELEKRLLSINPDVSIKKISSFITEDNIDMLFEGKIDYFIDACDTIKTKKLIIKKCIDNNIKSVTCLGTGKRLDSSKVCICDIRDTSYDPIAKKLRKFVKDNNIKEKVICCYSEEEPAKTDGTVIPSSAFVPSTAGILIASFIIRDIIAKKN